MFIPARKPRGPAAVCTRMPRLLSVATAGAVSVGAAFGMMPAAWADPPPGQRVSMAVDIVGDSYMAGEGLRDTYIDPADPRHRSVVAPALQALSRLASENSRLRVDANIVAASGAETRDFFFAQQGPDNIVVNAPQRDQVRPDAQVVIVGFGGEDARLAAVLADAKRTANGPNVVLDKEIGELGPLLDSTASDAEYLAQAKSSPLGQAPTLVARMLQVLAGIQARAPHATIVVTNYPLGVDPQNKHAASLVGEDELTSVRKFSQDLNKAIERAVRICWCGSLLDVSGAVAGHEAYTADSAFNEQPDQQAPRERFQPNQKGASLIANPIATGIAGLLRITPPKPSDGRMTIPENIAVHNGVPDRDGDRVPDSRDRAPEDPTRSKDARKPRPDAKHAPTGREGSSRHASTARPSSGSHKPVRIVTQTITRVVDGLTAAHGQSRPNDQHAPGTSTNAHSGSGQQPPASASRGTGQAQPRTEANRRAAGPAATGQTQPAKSDQRRQPNTPASAGQEPAEPDRRPAAFFRTGTDRAPAGRERPQAPDAAPATVGRAENEIVPCPDGIGQPVGIPGSRVGACFRIPTVILSATDGSKKPSPAGNPSPAFTPPPTPAPKREDQAPSPAADKRVTGTETSERTPNPADATPKLSAGRSSAPTTPDRSDQTQDETARLGDQFGQLAAAESSDSEGMPS